MATVHYTANENKISVLFIGIGINICILMAIINCYNSVKQLVFKITSYNVKYFINASYLLTFYQRVVSLFL